MGKETLYLTFAQWQGSSHRDAPKLMHGNRLLSALLNYLPFEKIAISSQAPAKISDKLQAKAEILAHAQRAKALIDRAQAQRIVTLGGDGSVDFLAISYLKQKYGKHFGLVWLDAHANLHSPASSASKAFQGMVLRTLLGEGDEDLLGLAYEPLLADQLILAAVRNFEPGELAYFDEQKIKLLTVAELSQRPEHLVEALEIRQLSSIYIHLDLDVLEPSEFSATAYLSPHGLRLASAQALLEQLYKNFSIVGFSLSEFLPHSDSDVTALLPLLIDNPLL